MFDVELVESDEAIITNIEETPIAYKFRRGAGDTIIVLFHGTVKKSGPNFPVFQRFLPLPAHQLAISDSGLVSDERLRTTWYLGTSKQRLPDIIDLFITTIMKKLNCTKVIFFGGSSGGFAALLYAWRSFFEAIAVAACPQINLAKFERTGAVKMLMKVGYPECATLDDLALKAPIDLSLLYKERFANKAICILSAGDHHHLFDHMGAFLSGLDATSERDLVLDVGYWGGMGHSDSVPSEAYLPWIRTALVAKSWSADVLLDTHRSIVGVREAATASGPSKHDHGGFSPSDLRMANLLRDLQLKNANVDA